LAVWGIAYSRWNKARGGCGSCSALGDPHTHGTCCMDRGPARPADEDKPRPPNA
ncbi:MAG: hypothetical protein GX591_02125, partial [Planctomycetes bacterium]|nr:hypothetical protein [Planctomycetota bacterium]